MLRKGTESTHMVVLTAVVLMVMGVSVVVVIEW